SQFSGTELKKRNLKGTQRVCRNADLEQQHQVRDQQARGNWPAHKAGKPESGEQKQQTKCVRDVVNVEAITWALAIAVAGEGAIQAVAQPVKRQAQHNHDETPAIP